MKERRTSSSGRMLCCPKTLILRTCPCSSWMSVAHKERLKELKSGVHVLTLTATPIPRTLQMALTGVRDLSVIATPPVDRLAVKTYILPFDRVIVKEAILREKFRGGQVFYVCPRISDMAPLLQTLQDLIPDLKIAAAHGQMPTSKLEKCPP